MNPCKRSCLRIICGGLVFSLITVSSAWAEDSEATWEQRNVSNGSVVEYTVGNLTLTAPSAVKIGEGAKLAMQGLTVAEGAILELTGDVLNNVRVYSALDADTLSRISVNGSRAYQSDSGYFSRKGLLISFR